MSEQPLPTLPIWRVDHIEPSTEKLALRANGPIHRVRFPSGHEGWWVTGYDEAKAVLSDAAFRPAGMPPAAFTPDSVILGSPGWLVSHEGGEHARLRMIVAPAFSNRRVKLLAQQVEAIAAQLFETLAAQPQPADLRRHLSFPLPAMVISALMGVLYEDHAFFAGLSDEVMTHEHESGPRSASRLAWPGPASPGLAWPGLAWEEPRAYIRGKMRDKRQDPGDNLLTDLLAAVDQGKATEEEAIGLAAGMLVAGRECTAAQIEFGLCCATPGRPSPRWGRVRNVHLNGARTTDAERVIAAMERCGWVQAKAARLLGLTPRQIGYVLRKYGIEIKRL